MQDFEFSQYDKIKELFPNGFHSVDKKGRPILILQVGAVNFVDLMQALNNSTDLLVHYFIKEMEHTWRVKFTESRDLVYKEGVDQIKVIIDLKGVKLKDLSSKPAIALYKQITLEVQRFFPCMLHRLYVLNAPIFFENIWDAQLSQCVDPETIKKVLISTSQTHEELLEEVDEYDLPLIYGGNCQCKATCIYSEKGPWSEVENFINYKDPNSRRFYDSDSDDLGDTCERDGADLGQFKHMVGGGLGGLNGAFGKLNKIAKDQEEFKMMEGDEDQVDLLEEKGRGGNMDDFYEQEGLDDLKNQILMNVPGLQGMSRMPGMS